MCEYMILFCDRYCILAFHANEQPAASPESCSAILEKAKLENWAMGKTKVQTPPSNMVPPSSPLCFGTYAPTFFFL